MRPAEGNEQNCDKHPESLGLGERPGRADVPAIHLDRRCIGGAIKKGPAGAKDESDHNAEKDPAVNDMVKTGGEIDITMMGNIDRSKGPDAIGSQYRPP